MHHITRMLFTISFLFIQCLTLIGLIKSAKYDYVYDIIATGTFLLIYTASEKRYGIYLKNYIRLLIMATIISHNLLGQYLNLYVISPGFDRVLHILGTYAFVLFTYSLLNNIMKKPLFNKPIEFVFLVLLGISLGSLLEIVEFITDMALEPEIPYQLNLIDTNLDLVSNVIGAIIAASHAALTDIARPGPSGRS